MKKSLFLLVATLSFAINMFAQNYEKPIYVFFTAREEEDTGNSAGIDHYIIDNKTYNSEIYVYPSHYFTVYKKHNGKVIYMEFFEHRHYRKYPDQPQIVNVPLSFFQGLDATVLDWDKLSLELSDSAAIEQIKDFSKHPKVFFIDRAQIKTSESIPMVQVELRRARY